MITRAILKPMDKIYLVKYYGGSYDNTFEQLIFVTTNISTAKAYVKRFNKILKKWQRYYHKYTDKKNGFTWIKDKYKGKYFYRWNSLRHIGKCYFIEAEVR